MDKTLKAPHRVGTMIVSGLEGWEAHALAVGGLELWNSHQRASGR
jgi:hypothetical protein